MASQQDNNDNDDTTNAASLEEDIGRITLVDDAPPIDYNVRVVVNLGVEVVVTPSKGRILKATKDFSLDDDSYKPILRERPAIICQQDDYMDFMEQFLDSPLQIQLGILDMYYQPLTNSPIGLSLVEPSRILYMLGVLEDLKVIHQLLCILNDQWTSISTIKCSNIHYGE